MKKNIGKDYRDLVNKEDFMPDMADNHLRAWASRYSEYDKKSEVRFDLNINHDDSIEKEYTEEELGRELTDDEYSDLSERFVKAVMKQLQGVNLSRLEHKYS